MFALCAGKVHFVGEVIFDSEVRFNPVIFDSEVRFNPFIAST